MYVYLFIRVYWVEYVPSNPHLNVSMKSERYDKIIYLLSMKLQQLPKDCATGRR